MGQWCISYRWAFSFPTLEGSYSLPDGFCALYGRNGKVNTMISSSNTEPDFMANLLHGITYNFLEQPKGSNPHKYRIPEVEDNFGKLVSTLGSIGFVINNILAPYIPECKEIQTFINSISTPTILFGKSLVRALVRGEKADLKRIKHMPLGYKNAKYGPEVEKSIEFEHEMFQEEQRKIKLYDIVQNQMDIPEFELIYNGHDDLEDEELIDILKQSSPQQTNPTS